ALQRPLAEVDFVVVDLETTGGAGDGIIEIGAARVAGGRIGERFVSLVNPGRPIQPFVMRLTGITDAMVAGAPPLSEVLPRFLEKLRERGVERLDQLLDYQRSASDGRPFVVHVPRTRLDDVPPVPGVYHLLGRDGRLLYVGKARRLRERLAAYFTNARGHSPR